MSYSRPPFDDADASWAGATAYTRPAHASADATFYSIPIVAIEGLLLVPDGLPAAPSFVGVVWRVGLLVDPGGLPAAPSLAGFSGSAGTLSAPALLAAPTLFGTASPVARLLDYGLPARPTVRAFFDTRPYLDDDAPAQFVMDVFVAGNPTRVPISSWQGTLQTGAQCYLSCVVPACAPWLETIQSADEFAVSRIGRYRDGSAVEVLFARAPLQSATIDRGPFNHTASLSGYFPPYPAAPLPDARFDRPLRGVRGVSSFAGGTRIRCSIDWFLRPGQRAVWKDLILPVAYINIYATGNLAYMDIGHRVQG